MSARTFPPVGLPLVVASWEIECCGPLPTVGQPTSWRLIFVLLDKPDLKSEEHVPGSVTEHHWQVEPLPGGSYGRALHRNGFAAYFSHSHWRAGGQSRPLPALGRQSLSGMVLGARHGGTEHDTFGSVTATVSRIQVVSWEHRLIERTLVRVPGSARLRDVRQSPKWFSSSPRPRRKDWPKRAGTGQDRSNPTVVDSGVYRDETGLLLTLCAETGASGEARDAQEHSEER